MVYCNILKRTVHFDNIAMDEIDFRPVTTPIPSQQVLPASLSPRRKYAPSESESATEIVGE